MTREEVFRELAHRHRAMSASDRQHTHSWQWALTKLLDGERLHWIAWGDMTWITFSQSGYLTRYSEIRGRIHSMHHFSLNRGMVTFPGWAIYEPPIEALRDEILFRQFSLNPSPDA